MGIRVVIYSLPFELERFFLFIALQRMDAFCKKVLAGFQFGR